QMSEADFGFKPVATVRSFGQIVAHVADDETGWCAQILGEPVKQTGYEKTLTAKADILKAIRDAGAYCEKAYAMTDAQAAGIVTIWRAQQPRIRGMMDNATHDWEHYGNIVTYLRIKGMVPPSSQGQ
ncbi:MAG TPA: DinB family protein, partial [Gemmatimonadaceae bacterium]|nr:DinB family protein [Gemmatimonadaceae bacterium]